MTSQYWAEGWSSPISCIFLMADKKCCLGKSLKTGQWCSGASSRMPFQSLGICGTFMGVPFLFNCGEFGEVPTTGVQGLCLAGNLITETDGVCIDILAMVFLTIKGRPCLRKQGVIAWFTENWFLSQRNLDSCFPGCSEHLHSYFLLSYILCN